MGVEFDAKEFKVGEVHARRDVVNITEEVGNTTKAIIACVARGEAFGGTGSEKGIKWGKETGNDKGCK